MTKLSAALILAPVLAAQTSRAACELEGPARSQFNSLPALHDFSLSWEQRMAARRALAISEPGNWALQVALQEPLIRTPHLSRDWDLAIEHYRRLPDSTLGALLEGRLLARVRRARSRELLDHALNAAPDSPWTHLALLEWAAFPGRPDTALAQERFESWRRLCPQSTLGFAHLPIMENVDRFAAHLIALRQILERRKKVGLESQDFSALYQAWMWEKAASVSQAGQQRFEAAVRSDLAALRELKLHDSPEWFGIVTFGYGRTLRDQSAVRTFENEVLETAPGSQSAWWIEFERAGPLEGALTGPKLALLRDRVARFGHRPAARIGLLPLVTDPATGEEEFRRLADLLLRIERLYPDQSVSMPPTPILIAEQFARRKIEVERIPALISEGLRIAEEQAKYRRHSDVIAPGPNDPAEVARRRADSIKVP